jgi:hypothetical protein
MAILLDSVQEKEYFSLNKNVSVKSSSVDIEFK